VVGSSAEWSFDPERLAELREVSRLSGGRELLDLSKAWLRPPATHSTDLRLPLAIAILVLMLFEALISRMGWHLPVLFTAKPRTAKRRKAVAGGAPVTDVPVHASEPGPEPAKPVVSEKPSSAPAPQPESSPTADPDDTQRRSRFDRAKRGK
jgi:hypothetical protein